MIYRYSEEEKLHHLHLGEAKVELQLRCFHLEEAEVELQFRCFLEEAKVELHHRRLLGRSGIFILER